MPKADVSTHAPIHHRLQVAAGRTGQADTTAGYLLAWWNAKSCRDFALTDLWTVGAIARDRLATAGFIAGHRDYPGTDCLGQPFEHLLALWRPAPDGTDNV